MGNERKSQADKFREAAGEAGVNEDEDAFDRMVKRIAPTKPDDTKPGDQSGSGPS